MKKKRIKRIFDSIRKPIPKPSRPLSTKKGKKGYNRKEARRKENEWEEYH